MAGTPGKVAIILEAIAAVVRKFEIDEDTIEGVNVQRAELQIDSTKFWSVAADAGVEGTAERFDDQMHWRVIVDGVNVVCVVDIKALEQVM